MAYFSIATTPTMRFVLKTAVDWSLAMNVYATITQNGVKIRKTGEDVALEDETHVSVYLSQGETVRFKAGKVDVQLNWTYPDGNRACTRIVTIDVDDNLERVVLE